MNFSNFYCIQTNISSETAASLRATCEFALTHTRTYVLKHTGKKQMSAMWHSWDVPYQLPTEPFSNCYSHLRERSFVQQEENQSSSGDSDVSAVVQGVQIQTEVDTVRCTLHLYITHIE